MHWLHQVKCLKHVHIFLILGGTRYNDYINGALMDGIWRREMVDGSLTVVLLLEHSLNSVVRGYYMFIEKKVSYMSSKNSKKMEHLWYEVKK